MTVLFRDVRLTLMVSGISLRTYVSHWFGPDARVWRGDACGCSDDRCIGYHHDETEDCLCFPVCLRDVLLAADVGTTTTPEPGTP